MTAVPPPSAGTNAQITRRARQNLRAAIASGALTLGELLADPPTAIDDLTLVDVIRWTRTRSGRVRYITQIGQWAVRDRINLLVTVAASSQRSRAWVGEHGAYGARCKALAT